MLAALRAADVVACEDTRHTRTLLDRYGVTGTLVSYHEHNERERAAELVARMRSGAVVALVSDAGMPLVSDPGFILVQACIAAGLSVEVLPGPSSALAALVASGLPAERWRFVGFLPRRRGRARAAAARDARRRSSRSSRRKRLVATLALLAAKDPERPVAVCRELTKLHEEVRRGTRGGARRPLRAASRRAARSCSSSRRRRPARSPTLRSGRWRRCARSSTPARARGRPPRRSPS